MAYLVELGRAHVTALVPTLADPDVPTRGRIVQVLGILGGPEALQALEPSTRDPDPAVARAAEHAIARIRLTRAVSTRPLAAAGRCRATSSPGRRSTSRAT